MLSEENLIGNYLIEGNIGSGKSTFLNKLKRISEDVVTVPEPVNVWVDYQGHNYLQLFYENQRKWTFPFQQLAVTTAADVYYQQKDKNCLKFFERSIYSPLKIFAQELYSQGVLSQAEMDLHTLVTNNTAKFLNYDIKGIIYVRTQPEISQQRVVARSRKEDCAIPLEYLQSLHKWHDEWLLNDNLELPVLTFNNDSSAVITEFDKLEAKIKEWIKSPTKMNLDPSQGLN